MKLVEAFRYSNYLTFMMDGVKLALNMPSFTHTTVVTHLMAGTVPGAENVTETREPDDKYSFFDPDMAITFLLALFEEKKNLMYAIDHAKPSLTDAEISLNKDRRNLGVLLSNLGTAPEKTSSDTNGFAYGLNNEGEQKSYTYKMHTESTARYNRVMARAVGKDLIQRAEEMSFKLDADKLTCDVNFHPMFDVNDTLEEAYNKYAASQVD